MKFIAFKDGRVAKDFVPTGIVLFGADRIPFRSTKLVTFQDGVIDCKARSNAEPTGLALLWPVEGFGNVFLWTTRLPERQQPYILNVELARAKLMEITNKREDWALFEEKNHFGSLANEIQWFFIQMLENINNPAKASVFADECLVRALKYSEQLTMKYADILFEARLKNRGFARSSIGCVIAPGQLENKNYQKALLDLFAHITIPVRWSKIEPVKGQYDWTEMDRCIEMLGKKRILICAGPLLCFDKKFLPDWLKAQEDFEIIRESAYTFVSKIVARYAKYVHIWLVLSGLNVYNHFAFGFEKVLEITRTACLAAREADNRSLKMIDVVFPWGEYYGYNPDTIPPLIYVDMVTQAGINYDALGVQMVFGKDEYGMHVRDMMQISAMLDRFALVPKPVHITAFGVPDTTSAEKQQPEKAGFWHKPWDQSQQAKWIEEFSRVALSKPFINTITYSALADGDENNLAGEGLLTADFEPKKAYQAIVKLQKKILQK